MPIPGNTIVSNSDFGLRNYGYPPFIKPAVYAITDCCDKHGVDAGDSKRYEIADGRAGNDADHGTPVDIAFLVIPLFIGNTVQEIIQNDDHADGRQRGIQKAEPGNSDKGFVCCDVVTYIK